MMYTDCIELLKNNRLKETLAKLKIFADELDNWQMQQEVERIQSTYGLMLEYMERGVVDPQQEMVYNRIMNSAYELIDRAEFIRKNREGKTVKARLYNKYQRLQPSDFSAIGVKLEAYAQDWAMLELSGASETELNAQRKALALQHERQVDALFYKIWVSLHWSEEDLAEAEGLFNSLMISANDLAVMVSAVTLNLLEYFDEAKLRLLVKVYLNRTETVITQRALVGIAWVVMAYSERVERYPDLKKRLDLLKEQPKLADELYRIQTLFLLTRETEKLDGKMDDEIMNMISKNPNIMDAPFNLDDLDEMNPEWKEGLTKLSEEAGKMNRLQMEGVDTYVNFFSKLKTSAFFSETPHWFYPFDLNQSELVGWLSQEDTKSSPTNLVLRNPLFCDSDKYSIAQSFLSIPTSMRGDFFSMLNMNDLPQEGLSHLDELQHIAEKAEFESQRYIHDLYRFFYYSSPGKELSNIFKSLPLLWENPIWAGVMDLSRLAEFLFGKAYYKEAKEVYQMLVSQGVSDGEVYQKYGFSCQKEGDYVQAVAMYEHADILNPDNPWTLKRIGRCYKQLKEYQKALDVFMRLNTLQSEKADCLFQIGQCMVGLHEYQEALSYLFKVEYLKGCSENISRSIAWCCFKLGKYEKAIAYYEKNIQEASGEVSDWLNLGHVYLVEGLLGEAVKCYRQVERECGSHEAFLKLYQADFPVVEIYGIDRMRYDWVAEML